MIEKLKEIITKYSSAYFALSILMLTFILMFFFNPICPGHDFPVHFNRLYCLMEAMENGSFLNYMDYYVIEGYGYIIKNFYSDLLFIPYAIIGLLTTPTFAYKTIIFSLTLLSAFFMYKAVFVITKNRYTAYFSSLLYTFSTYRILDIYLRCAIGEVFAIAFIPLVVWGAYEIINGNYKKWYILTIGFCLLIYSHVISSVLIFIFLIIFIFIYNKNFRKEPKRFYYLVLSGIVCIALCIYYFIPLIEQLFSNTFYYESHNSKDMKVDSFSFVLSHLFNAVPFTIEKFYAKTGLLILVPLIFRLFVKERKKLTNFFDICTIIGLGCILALTEYFPWNYFPFNKLIFIQFAYRLNMIITLFFAMSGAYYLSEIVANRKQKVTSYILFYILSVILISLQSVNYKYVICNHQEKLLEVSRSSSIAAIGSGEYLPAKVPVPFSNFYLERENAVIPQNESTKITNFTKDKGHITFDVEVTGKDNLELPLTYYIGYKATLDGEEVEYQQSEVGLIEIPINKSGKVEIQYVGTTLQKVSWYITLISLLLFAACIVYFKRKNE